MTYGESFVIIISIVFHAYRTLINLPYSFLHSDNVISSLHVNRMIEFGLNVYQSTWNEHTTLLIYIQKYAIQIFRIFGFENDLLIYFIVFSGIAALINLISLFSLVDLIKEERNTLTDKEIYLLQKLANKK